MKVIKIHFGQTVPWNFTGKAIFDSGMIWHLKDGLKHREDDPAEYLDDIKIYYINGQRHRIGGPAAVYASGNEYYYINGKEVTKEQHDLLVLMLKLKGI